MDNYTAGYMSKGGSWVDRAKDGWESAGQAAGQVHDFNKQLEGRGLVAPTQYTPDYLENWGASNATYLRENQEELEGLMGGGTEMAPWMVDALGNVRKGVEREYGQRFNNTVGRWAGTAAKAITELVPGGLSQLGQGPPGHSGMVAANVRAGAQPATQQAPGRASQQPNQLYAGNQQPYSERKDPAYEKTPYARWLPKNSYQPG